MLVSAQCHEGTVNLTDPLPRGQFTDHCTLMYSELTLANPLTGLVDDLFFVRPDSFRDHCSMEIVMADAVRRRLLGVAANASAPAGESVLNAKTRAGIYMLTRHRSTSVHMQDGGSFGRLSRRVGALPMISGAAAVVLLASAHAFADAPENPTRVARVHHACAIVMGLPQPGDLYNACVSSLNQSLSRLDQARLRSTDRITCSKDGIRRGTPAFADCVLEDLTSTDGGR